MMFEQIKNAVKLLVPIIREEDVSSFVDICKPVTIQQGKRFLDDGQVPKKFAFVISGLIRYYYVDTQGREFTKVFLGKNSFVSSYTAMRHGTKSFYAIEALIDTDLVEINWDQWEKLRASNPLWDKLLIALLEKGYGVKEKRERDLLLLDAESRYKIFREEFFDVESFIKQRLIASYLGITPVALSRIRKKMGV